MESEWRSVIAVSLNVGGGVRRKNCACARKTLQTQRGLTHGAGCVRQWFRTTRGTSLRELEYTQDRGNLGIIFHISPYKMLWFLIKTLLPILELLLRFSVFHRLPYSVKVITQKV